MVFAVFTLIDFFARVAMKYVPFYWLVKCGFLLYLYLPFTQGAKHLYKDYIRPFFAGPGRAILRKITGAGFNIPLPPKDQEHLEKPDKEKQEEPGKELEDEDPAVSDE